MGEIDAEHNARCNGFGACSRRRRCRYLQPIPRARGRLLHPDAELLAVRKYKTHRIGGAHRLGLRYPGSKGRGGPPLRSIQVHRADGYSRRADAHASSRRSARPRHGKVKDKIRSRNPDFLQYPRDKGRRNPAATPFFHMLAEKEREILTRLRANQLRPGTLTPTPN